MGNILAAKLQAGKIKVQEIISGMDEDDNVIEEESVAVTKVLKSLNTAQTAWSKHQALREKKRPKAADREQAAKLRETVAASIKSVNFNSRQIDAMCLVVLQHRDKINTTSRQLVRHQKELGGNEPKVEILITRSMVSKTRST